MDRFWETEHRLEAGRQQLQSYRRRMRDLREEKDRIDEDSGTDGRATAPGLLATIDCVIRKLGVRDGAQRHA